jgi:hypothetical protein
MGILIFQASSCKGPQPCKAVITVFDSIGVHPQPNVKVHLYANVTYNGNTYQGDLTVDAVTNSSGQANFTIKNPCILDIRATACDTGTSHPQYKYCLGTGIIRFDEGVTNTKSVNLNQ